MFMDCLLQLHFKQMFNRCRSLYRISVTPSVRNKGNDPIGAHKRIATFFGFLQHPAMPKLHRQPLSIAIYMSGQFHLLNFCISALLQKKERKGTVDVAILPKRLLPVHCKWHFMAGGAMKLVKVRGPCGIFYNESDATPVCFSTRYRYG